MKLAPLGIALVAVAAVGCFPATEPITRGIAIGTTGGTATDVLVFTVQPSNVTAGNVMTPAVQVEPIRSAGTSPARPPSRRSTASRGSET